MNRFHLNEVSNEHRQLVTADKRSAALDLTEKIWSTKQNVWLKCADLKQQGIQVIAKPTDIAVYLPCGSMDCVFSQQTCLRGDQLCLKTVACSAPWHDLQGCVGIKTNYLLTLPHSYQFYTPTVPYC